MWRHSRSTTATTTTKHTEWSSSSIFAFNKYCYFAPKKCNQCHTQIYKHCSMSSIQSRVLNIDTGIFSVHLDIAASKSPMQFSATTFKWYECAYFIHRWFNHHHHRHRHHHHHRTGIDFFLFFAFLSMTLQYRVLNYLTNEKIKIKPIRIYRNSLNILINFAQFLIWIQYSQTIRMHFKCESNCQMCDLSEKCFNTQNNAD